jgi:hypothetical protein
MKTKIKKALSLTAILACFLIPKHGLSQTCNYTLNNTSNCNLTVTVRWYDDTVPPCANICNTQSLISVPANSFKSLTCSGCAIVCNVEVIVTSPMSITVDANTQNGNNSGGGCSTVYAQWGTSSTDFHN